MFVATLSWYWIKRLFSTWPSVLQAILKQYCITCVVQSGRTFMWVCLFTSCSGVPLSANIMAYNCFIILHNHKQKVEYSCVLSTLQILFVTYFIKPHDPYLVYNSVPILQDSHSDAHMMSMLLWKKIKRMSIFMRCSSRIQMSSILK